MLRKLKIKVFEILKLRAQVMSTDCQTMIRERLGALESDLASWCKEPEKITCAEHLISTAYHMCEQVWGCYEVRAALPGFSAWKACWSGRNIDQGNEAWKDYFSQKWPDLEKFRHLNNAIKHGEFEKRKWNLHKHTGAFSKEFSIAFDISCWEIQSLDGDRESFYPLAERAVRTWKILLEDAFAKR